MLSIPANFPPDAFLYRVRSHIFRYKKTAAEKLHTVFSFKNLHPSSHIKCIVFLLPHQYYHEQSTANSTLFDIFQLHISFIRKSTAK